MKRLKRKVSKLLTLVLVIVMVFTMVPSTAFAADRDETKKQVRVIVENTTYTVANGAPWEGTLVDTWVDIDENSTMMSCLLDALGSYSQTGADTNYISEINGLSAMDGGDMAGWMGMINDWFVNAGFNEFTVANGTLENGDEIKIFYSCDGGFSEGSDWSNNDKRVSKLEINTGELSPVFNEDTKEYTLTLPADTTSVVVTPTAKNKNFQVRASVDGTEYKRSDKIPVSDGTIITVTCGDVNWPSMNAGAYGCGAENVPAEVYTVTVDIEESVKGTPVTVTDNVIDITDKTIASWNRYSNKATNIYIEGADVVSATEDGTNVYVVLDSAADLASTLTVTFGTSVAKGSVSPTANTVTLENGTGKLEITLNSSWKANFLKGSVTYTIYFSGPAAPTVVPNRIVETDSVEVYTGIELYLDLSKYFEKETDYYIVDGEELKPLDGKTYTFMTTEGGNYSLVFAASNTVGMCADYVTVTITAKEIESGIWVGKETSNGAFNFVTFSDTAGNPIEGIECTISDKEITVALPKDYDVAGKIVAKFNLTQNSSNFPRISTSNAFNKNNNTYELATTLSSGTAKVTVYLYNTAPKATSNVYETYTINYAVKNELPTLVEGQAVSVSSEITAGDVYKVNLKDLFTDAEGDALTYFVQVNDAAAIKAEVDADGGYSFSTDTAGEYKLVFTAYDGKGTSTDTYTVDLTVKNTTETNEMIVKVPDGLSPSFYVTNGFDNNVDVLGDELTAILSDDTDTLDSYIVSYPTNASYISIRTDDWGGMAVAVEKNGLVTMRKAMVEVLDFSNSVTNADVSVAYESHFATKGTKGYLLATELEYTYTATPADSATYNTATANEKLENEASVCNISLKLTYKSPKTITITTGATAQLFDYNKYYDLTEVEPKAIVDNGNGTTTYYFISSSWDLSYRVSMDGKITKAGYWDGNVVVDYTNEEKTPETRVDYTTSSADNANVGDDSVLVNVNKQNNLVLSNGDTYTLKGYRAWEIIKYSYQNEIITPNFNFNIISGKDVIRMESKDSRSNSGTGDDSDWRTITALKEGTAIVEVTYDAIEVTGGHYSGIYGASDPARSGLIVVQVGGSDASVDFGIDCFAGMGSLVYAEENAKAWDAEFDTLYFVGDNGELNLSPTANSDIKEVAVSNDKGASWTVLNAKDDIYTAKIVSGNNIIRVTTDAGCAYQVVRGDKLITSITEVTGASDGDGLVAAGETIRVALDGLHTPIPKMAGNYNPGYAGNTAGDSKVRLVYTYKDEVINGKGVQYTFAKEANYVEVTIPENYIENSITLSDGYIGVGVIGLTTFASDGDSHRNIPDAGCTTRGSETTFNTRSILPDITIQIGEMASENNAPNVNDSAPTTASITLGQNYAINPETFFTDRDGDILTYQVSVNGDEATAVDAAFKFSPTQTGTYTLVFTASDTKEKVSHTITLTVTPAMEDDKDDELVFDIFDDQIAGYVNVSFEDFGVRVEGETGLKYPVALGTIIEPVKVPFAEGDSIATVTVRLINALGMECTYSGTTDAGFYLSSIKNFEANNTPYDEMGEHDAGSGSGWMITQNGVFINMGASEFTVSEGDNICWKYTCQLGADIGDDFYTETTQVENLIDAIGTVTESSEAAIIAARDAYDDLSDYQKQKVNNYDKLIEAEKTLAEIQANLLDKLAANKVEKLITEIGTVTLDSKSAIAEARNAYEELTDLQQKLVENYDVLIAAENTLLQLQNPTHSAIYKESGDILEATSKEYPPTVASIGGDWMVLGLVRSGRDVPTDYYDNVVAYVKENINANNQLHRAKSTENARVILALTAAGYDPTDVAGYNLLEGLTDMSFVKKQGHNGPMWTLIAFDSHDYEIPEGGTVTRDALITEILNTQLSDGGWNQSASLKTSDTDMTAMAIQALATYYNTDANVKTAIDQAVSYLSKQQYDDGSFGSVDGKNAESCAQVIVALTALNINPENDARFVKNGISVVDALCGFYLDGKGFEHVASGGVDGMAMEQAYYAMAAYFRLLNGQTSLYDMSDVTIKDVPIDTNKPTDENKSEISTDAGKYEDTTPSTNLGDSKLEESITELQTAIPFTKEELARVENGEDVDIWLEVSDISKTVPVLDIVKVKTIVKKELEGHTVCMYFDVNLFKQIGSDDPTKITELHKPVTIKMTVPEAYINTNDKVLRIYEVVRVHDGVAEIIETDFNASTNELSFETDCFSTYALTYKDIEKTGSPQTDDLANGMATNPIWMVVAVAILAAGSIVYRKHQSYK